MSTAIILDTETTGVDEPEVIELAYVGPLATPRDIGRGGVQMQFKPRKPISLGAMATHHIINEDLVGCEPWPGSWKLPPELDSVNYLVGHNVDFDWKAIGSPGIRRICTLACARDIWPNLDSHKLGALIYHLYPHAMARELVKGAHAASVDVDLCARVLFVIADIYGVHDWESLWQRSEHARIPRVFSFGKYKGAAIEEVKKTDRSYIAWCLSGKCDIVNDDPYWQQALQA